MRRNTKPIVQCDPDDAVYIGSESDGVYFQVAETPAGFFVTAWVDSDTGGFVDTLFTDDGPYACESDAADAGQSAAIDWCLTNGVSFDDPDTNPDPDVDDPDPDPEETDCPACRSAEGSVLGTLGRFLWFRCRACGIDYYHVKGSE